MIPSVFSGAPEVYDVWEDNMLNQTSTATKQKISEKSRAKLRTGPLRHQYDLYNLIKSQYEEKLYKYDIKYDRF